VIILVSSQTHAASKPNENSSAIKKWNTYR
jgi:hypothetical protein